MFSLLNQDKEARNGILTTNHGKVETPFFMPIATKGTAKQISPEELDLVGSQALIANAFILSLKPGLELLNQFKGLHNFMKWNKTIFTDSGGFQILSKTFLDKANDKGVSFKNPYTGQKQFYTPEDVISIEENIGSDVSMALDYVPHYGTDRASIEECTRITHHWAERCAKAHTKKDQLLFGICQGGTFKDLRQKSASFINSLDFDGIALGGLGIGEGSDLMKQTIQITTPYLNKEKPRYLMGVGSPEDLLEAISLGIDCFDSRFPTMNSRHGGIFTFQGKINIEKVAYSKDETPLDENCSCPICKSYSKAFIHHLYRTHEPISERYGSIHNLYFIQKLLEETRLAIKENRFDSFKEEFLISYKVNPKKNTVFSYH